MVLPDTMVTIYSLLFFPINFLFMLSNQPPEISKQLAFPNVGELQRLETEEKFFSLDE
jgi:hypothetical protein